MASESRLAEGDFGPGGSWLAAGFLVTGLGTVLLGPLLPTLAHQWHLSDSQSGLLLLAKFVGAFLGGVAIPRRLRLGIFSGTLLAFLGFTVFGLAHSLLPGCLGLFVSGVGLGQIIASTNILVGRRYRTHTGSALSSLNFFWSLGAVLTGLLAAALLPRFGLRSPLLWFAGSFLVLGVCGFLRPIATSEQSFSLSSEDRRLPLRTFLLFATLLFLYGGLETCLTSWITTFTLRFSDLRLLAGQSGVVLLWASLTAGRALAAGTLRFMSERTIQRLGMVLSILFIGLLLVAHQAFFFSLCCILLGISLAPFFPSTFALLMRDAPPARVAGFILAVSGLGAALFPWLMGVISTQTGSLRIAMGIPWMLAVMLLLLTLIPARASAHRP